MKKTGIAIAVAAWCAAALFAQNTGGAQPAPPAGGALSAATANEPVDTDEFSALPEVNFVNYAGPYARVDSRAEIMELGRAPGRAIRGGDEGSGDLTRYFVIHSVTPDTGDGKLNADVFGLGRNAGVDHIRALRLIIQGYLEEAYAYASDDAALLAQYITVYNAVHRKDMTFFSSRYKKPVLDNLSADAAGLATNYTEWPAATLMVIPLRTAEAGSLSALDTTSLTAPEVAAHLKESPDASVPVRQDMVDLKEREAAEATDKAAAQAETVKKQTDEIAAQKEAITAEKTDVAEEKKAAETQLAAAKTPEEKQAAEEKVAEVAKKEDAVAQKEADVAQKEAAVEDVKQAQAQNEQLAAQKTAEAQKEREDIAQDQQKIIDTGGPVTTADTSLIAFALNSAGGTEANARVTPVKLDGVTKAIKTRSADLTTIRPRSLVQSGGRFFAIAGEASGGGGNQAIRLVEIDTATLGMKNQGADDMLDSSPIWVNGADLYALTSSGGTTKLARFDLSLKKQAESAKPVSNLAVVVINGGNLLTQNTDGTPLVLNPASLTE